MIRDGTVLVASSKSHQILAVKDGQVRALVEATENGVFVNNQYAGGTQLTGPSGVVVASDGSIVFSDFDGHAVFSISGNEIRRILGTGDRGGTLVQGSPTDTKLNNPHGVAITPDGSTIVADRLNGRILAVKENTVTHIAGTGRAGNNINEDDATKSEFQMLTTIAVAPDGTIVAADRHDGRVLLLIPDDEYQARLNNLFNRGTQAIQDGVEAQLESVVSDLTYLAAPYVVRGGRMLGPLIAVNHASSDHGSICVPGDTIAIPPSVVQLITSFIDSDGAYTFRRMRAQIMLRRLLAVVQRTKLRESQSQGLDCYFGPTLECVDEDEGEVDDNHKRLGDAVDPTSKRQRTDSPSPDNA